MSFSSNGPTWVAAQRANMAETAENAAHIARERPDVGSLAAFGLENRMVRIGLSTSARPWMSTGRASSVDLLAVARQIIGALALDLDRGEARRHLHDRCR